MPFKKERHPDMNLNDLDYSITYKICQNFDIDRSWELLAGVIGYSTSQIQTFELECQRANGSPTKKLLWDWGSRGGTIRNLYDKLELINKTQSMRLLEHIVKPEKEKEKECKVDNNQAEDDSLSSKSDNFCNSDNMDRNFYDTDSLPIPSMKKCGPVVKETNTPDVNFNMPCMKSEKTGNKSPMFDKILSTMLEPQGASSVEMFAHADGPASIKANLGAASSAARSFERVRSVIEEYGSEGMNMSGWSESEQQIAHALMGTPNYTYKDLSVATDGFSVRNRLGHGKYGEVYYGIVKNTKCAIKKLTQKREQTEDVTSTLCMAAELKTLSRYRHENIVSLYGYTLDEDEVCLVYQYMTNGSMYQCLHCRPDVILTWEQRLSILRGAACGLQFLHTVDKKPVIHGDIKSANILLDNHFEAKIGDLGLAKQATGGEVPGRLTHITKKTTSIHDYRNKAYHPPEIARGNGFSIKGDAYSFGVVMFECLSGQEAYDERREGSVEHKYLVEYIQSAIEDSPKLNRQKTFQDPKLKISFPTTTFEVLFEVAQRCTKEKKKDRPNMVEVYAEIDKCENDHSGPEYQNIQEAVEHKGKGKQEEAGSIHEHHMVVKNQPSYSPDLKAPPGVSPNKAVPKSPIDLLPKDQPLPEAFRLQLQLDQKQQKAVEKHDYENVDQKTNKMRSSFMSDPKKLEKMEKFDKENVSQTPDKGQSVSPGLFRPSQPLENTEKICVSEKTRFDGDVFIYKTASDPEKDIKLGASVKSPKEVEYENIPDFPTGNDGTRVHAEGNQCSELDTGIDDEFKEIARKATKGYSSMNGIFDKFHHLAEDEQLINVPDLEPVDDEEFDIKFDFETEDSESSTITESINNDLDFCSADFNDDALFLSESHVHYANVPEKVSNANIDASLEEHQKKLSMYQGMTRNDSEELHERSAQQEDTDLAVKNLPAQNKSHSQTVYENGFGVGIQKYDSQGHYQNCPNLGQGQGHCESKQAAVDYSNISTVDGNRNRQDMSNAGKIASIQDLLQRREPAEGHCEEYV